MVSKRAIHNLASTLLQAGFLNEREKEILQLRIGLNGEPPYTLQAIGQKYNISRERVRQIGTAIIRKTKIHMPEAKAIARKIFSKAWEPKYFEKERKMVYRRAGIKRKKTMMRNRAKRLAEDIESYAVTREGKDNINCNFKYLRIRYRKNKSLFDQDVVDNVKQLRKRWSDVKKTRRTTIAPVQESTQQMIMQQDIKHQEIPPETVIRQDLPSEENQPPTTIV
jgi:DNA-binding CsgD family transcriptional regulator